MVRQYAESCEYLTELVQSAKSDMEKMTKERKKEKKKSQKVARKFDIRPHKC